ncbi:MAG: fumarylacetoacetase [Streptosporangiaceae bacterium]
MALTSWLSIPEDSDFPVQHLPYAIFSRRGELPRVGVGVGDYILDLAALSEAGLIENRRWFAAGSLSSFMGAGRQAWQANRERLTELLIDERYGPDLEPRLFPRAEVDLHMPFHVADYIDFYSSLEHASNLGRMFRPDAEPLLANWRHLPVAYHGRSGTVVPSGTPVVRPCGQRKAPDERTPTFGPSARLDIEAEVGFVVGVPSPLGHPVTTADFREHVFGFVLVNDWSARDIQVWEARPLGPFLGKSFATSISPWVVPVAALEAARVEPPAQDPTPLPYLRVDEPWGLDLTLDVSLNGRVIARPPFKDMYWTPPQQLAHATIGGASLRTGDLMASGTVSGSQRGQRGSLIELTWNGEKPLKLSGGEPRVFLEDGDVVTMRATAPGADGVRIGFGEVTGTIQPAVE